MRRMIGRKHLVLALLLALLGGAPVAMTSGAEVPVGSPYAQWPVGPSTDPTFFPIGVWLQNPNNAGRYKEAGINVYVGLWKGPTEEQLAILKRYGMRVIAHQNEVGLKHRDDPVIMAWMHDDEPDNAQPKPGGGYGPPVPPAKVIEDYRRMVAADPSRPVFLNLGQGVANDEWKGRGPGARLDDYVGYCQGADIVSFDVYPVAGIGKPDGENYLWYVAKGLDRLRAWCGESRILWNVVETTNISAERGVTPYLLRAEVWMSLIHGSRGIIYFVHRFRPGFVEAALLQDPEMLRAVTAINRQIHELAPVLNSPSLAGAVSVSSAHPDVPIDILVKRYGDALYIFAVGMRNAATEGTFTIAGLPEAFEVEVLGEDRTLRGTGGTFRDAFQPYEVHLYRIRLG